ncbi:Mzm1p KNAG_0K02170 [Huiozyma naganishii CBS 8797]|uniref:Mitochondrial zinc maintenance protein 1, mitochondrial n=1 Tax=Huiozyma naganishii (strain ATCC MYA-139 / BCRC 22969 / CBS 8797 / KCTC 17520 / NBRC 10181 / NCYC 3082 / Yp74L-3) TaxID=1071383 RepID=J7RCI8_HUIN7|nr:hypothetical protein KNAG_0K02170 [Kazachstania naganishii CBS 8797]CCK72580.1 hypothetical protein KNAG_0K02170 [Kazachstania naganishii CBS 8797]
MGTAALTAYRHALRAARVAFQGDTAVLLAARSQMRSGMLDPPDKTLSPAQQAQYMEDVATYLRRNVVQATRVNTAGGPPEQHHQPRFHLNIHGDTELGDNDSIRNKTQLKAKHWPKR